MTSPSMGRKGSVGTAKKLVFRSEVVSSISEVDWFTSEPVSPLSLSSVLIPWKGDIFPNDTARQKVSFPRARIILPLYLVFSFTSFTTFINYLKWESCGEGFFETILSSAGKGEGFRWKIPSPVNTRKSICWTAGEGLKDKNTYYSVYTRARDEVSASGIGRWGSVLLLVACCPRWEKKKAFLTQRRETPS